MNIVSRTLSLLMFSSILFTTPIKAMGSANGNVAVGIAAAYGTYKVAEKIVHYFWPEKNYKVIALQEENEHLKKQIIAAKNESASLAQSLVYQQQEKFFYAEKYAAAKERLEDLKDIRRQDKREMRAFFLQCVQAHSNEACPKIPQNLSYNSEDEESDSEDASNHKE